MSTHIDLVRNEWLAGYQERMERIGSTDPRSIWRGDYVFATEPHTDEDCPFRESERLPLVTRAIRTPQTSTDVEMAEHPEKQA